MNDFTIVYYSSNREKPDFERKITDKLEELAGGIPIISVSHKPMDLGTNICVGEQHPCDINIFRQLLLGCKAAKTPFVISAESDCLYPPDYFQYKPEKLDVVYRHENIWIMTRGSNKVFKKKFSACGQIVGREYLIALLEDRFNRKKFPLWATESNPRAFEGRPYPKFGRFIRKRSWIYFGSENPILNIKTGDGLRAHTGVMKEIPPRSEVPYWGSIEALSKELWK